MSDSGSSPLVRGTPGNGITINGFTRFIPAGAGNTFVKIGCIGEVTVHPRWCGEHLAFVVAITMNAGSSPLVRGTQLRQIGGPVEMRFIPAGAGNTLVSKILSRVSSVHPRWCGEHFRMAIDDGPDRGSSPLVRGTPAGSSGRASGMRFIPAGAGNTDRSRSTTAQSPVHPRWCGEHAVSVTPITSVAGSSPLVRGTRLFPIPSLMRSRFIPAGAGNTFVATL